MIYLSPGREGIPGGLPELALQLQRGEGDRGRVWRRSALHPRDELLREEAAENDV